MCSNIYQVDDGHQMINARIVGAKIIYTRSDEIRYMKCARPKIYAIHYLLFTMKGNTTHWKSSKSGEKTLKALFSPVLYQTLSISLILKVIFPSFFHSCKTLKNALIHTIQVPNQHATNENWSTVIPVEREMPRHWIISGLA